MALALWVAQRPLLASVGLHLVVADPPERADAIIVLGGDWKGRIQKGIELYRAGYAPVLVVTGAPLVAPETTQADFLAEVARAAGVPASAILVEPRSESTYQDAALTLALARQHGWMRVLVVTSDWHSRRARSTFRKLYGPEGIEVRSVPSQEWRFDTERWWEYPDGGETIVIEWVRLIWYALRF